MLKYIVLVFFLACAWAAPGEDMDEDVYVAFMKKEIRALVENAKKFMNNIDEKLKDKSPELKEKWSPEWNKLFNLNGDLTDYLAAEDDDAEKLKEILVDAARGFAFMSAPNSLDFLKDIEETRKEVVDYLSKTHETIKRVTKGLGKKVQASLPAHHDGPSTSYI